MSSTNPLPPNAAFQNLVNELDKIQKEKTSINVTNKLATYAEQVLFNHKSSDPKDLGDVTIAVEPSKDSKKEEDPVGVSENQTRILTQGHRIQIKKALDSCLSWDTSTKIGSAIKNCFLNFSRYSTATRLLKATHTALGIKALGESLIIEIQDIKDQTDPNFQIIKNKLDSIQYALSTLIGKETNQDTISKQDFEELTQKISSAINSIPAMKQEDLIKGLAARYSSKAFSAISSFSFVSSAHKELRKLNKKRFEDLVSTLKSPPSDKKQLYNDALEAISKDLNNLDFVKSNNADKNWAENLLTPQTEPFYEPLPSENSLDAFLKNPASDITPKDIFKLFKHVSDSNTFTESDLSTFESLQKHTNNIPRTEENRITLSLLTQQTENILSRISPSRQSPTGTAAVPNPTTSPKDELKTLIKTPPGNLTEKTVHNFLIDLFLSGIYKDIEPNDLLTLKERVDETSFSNKQSIIDFLGIVIDTTIQNKLPRQAITGLEESPPATNLNDHQK